MSDSAITLQEYMLKSSPKKKKKQEKKKKEYMLKGIMNTNHILDILDSKIPLQRFLSSWERHLF